MVDVIPVVCHLSSLPLSMSPRLINFLPALSGPNAVRNPIGVKVFVRLHLVFLTADRLAICLDLCDLSEMMMAHC